MAELVLAAPPTTSKRLAIFLDGTTDKSEVNTNVWRARSLCAAKGLDGKEQRIFYSPGVGTQLGEILRGEVFGYGIDDVVVAAYEWLVENYEDQDEVFVFGFSRGAYTARALAGFISRCGLIQRARRSRSSSSTTATGRPTRTGRRRSTSCSSRSGTAPSSPSRKSGW